MERIIGWQFSSQLKAYSSLVKPGIIFGNALTAIGGFALASRGDYNFLLFFVTLLGLSLIIGSGCVFNNYIDRNADQKMKRTQERALVVGSVTPETALLFATLLAAFGSILLAFFVNFLTLGVALLGLVVYVLVYTPLKYRTLHGTLIGSVAGAVPPVVGYCAVTNHVDLGAFLLFLMIVLWQMPHFYAIALYRMKEYAAASIPVLPLKKGILTTKVHMLLYLVLFVPSACSLTFFGYTGRVYLIAAAVVSVAWLVCGIQGFRAANYSAWARKMFILSLVAVTVLCLIIPFSIQ